MELVYETEMNEKGAAKLFLRRRGFLKGLREFFATLSVLWTVGAIYYLLIMRDGGRINITEFLISILGTLFFLFCFFIVDRVVVQKVRRAYRQRKTNQVEYRLTNDKLAFTVGETTFSSPWNKVAKKFRIDRKAIYLYGKDLPFEAQCIPEWRGHGVERKELVAMLKKAGLKKMISGWLKSLMGLAVTFVLITCYFYIGGIEWGDWTIPNEAELRLELRDVPDEDNAYIALMALTNLYHVADNGQATKTPDGDSSKDISDKDFVSYYGDPFNSEDREKRAAVRSDPASLKRAEKILAGNAEFFGKFRAALSLKGYAEIDKRLEDAKRAKEGNPPWLLYLPSYKSFIDFARLVELRAQVALENGDVESAVAAIDDIHALGQLVQVNNESLVAYLVGVLIEKYSFWKMCDVVAKGKATDEVVERFSRMVAVSEANAPMAWERALKAEIAMHFEGEEWICDHPDNFIKGMLFDIFGNDWANSSPGDWDNSSLQFLCRILSGWPGFVRFAFHRREMLYRQAVLGRAMLAGDDDLMEMILHEIPRNPFLPNCAGNILAVALCPSFTYAKSYGLDRRRPQLVLAAEKWRRAHGGENPPTLDALVPYYLAAVPADPWDKSGGPIKYDAESGVAWSVGKEGEYDYRKVAKERRPADADKPLDGDTQTYAFRLDGKPINSEVAEQGHGEAQKRFEEIQVAETRASVCYDVKARRHWLVPVASCRTAMRGRYDSRAFISGMDRGLVEGEVISPSVGKCGYRVLSISDNCVWFEAFYDDEPPKDKLPHVTWPDFSRIDTISPTPPPGCLMLGKRKFWLGDAIKLPSGFYLMVDDFLDGKAAVFRLLDSGMRPVRYLLCVIVREEK